MLASFGKTFLVVSEISLPVSKYPTIRARSSAFMDQKSTLQQNPSTLRESLMSVIAKIL